MPGKRRDFAGSFAMLEVEFILDDPRFDAITAAARWVYIVLWCLAVQQRRETLPETYSVQAVARRARVDARTTRECLTKLQQNRLIEISPQGAITVCRVKKKHPNLTWKDDGISEDLRPECVAQSELESESESESELQRPTVSVRTRKKTAEKTKPKARTRAPTEIEAAFIDGFRNCYRHEPEIEKPHAIRLNELTTKHGPELVQAKIVAWWQSPAGQWCKGNRTIGAFLHAFDQITVGINPHDGIAVAREILRQRRERGGNGGSRSSRQDGDQLPLPPGRQHDSVLAGPVQDAEVVGGADW